MVIDTTIINKGHTHYSYTIVDSTIVNKGHNYIVFAVVDSTVVSKGHIHFSNCTETYQKKILNAFKDQSIHFQLLFIVANQFIVVVNFPCQNFLYFNFLFLWTVQMQNYPATFYL